MHIYVYVYVYIYVYIYTNTHAYICIYICIHMYIYVQIHVYKYACPCKYIWNIYLRVYIHIFTWIHKCMIKMWLVQDKCIIKTWLYTNALSNALLKFDLYTFAQMHDSNVIWTRLRQWIEGLKFRLVFAKEPQIMRLIGGKWPTKIGHPTRLRHPVKTHRMS